MSKKKIFNILAIILGVITCFSFSKVQAAEFDSGITRDSLTAYTTTNFNMLNSNAETLILKDSDYTYDGSKKVWKIINETFPNNIYYCLNMTRGFNGMVAENTPDEYSYKQELTKIDFDKYSGLTLTNNTYNKILWILDNSYVPTNSSNIYAEDTYKLLMKNAGIGISLDNTYNLTEDDIVTAQRLAIWKYTNNFNAASSIGGVDDQNETDGWGNVVAKSRKAKLLDLYNYLVNNAKADYTRQEPNIILEKTDVEIQETEDSYIVGEYYLEGENISLIKSMSVSSNKPFVLLDSSKNAVNGNDFSKVLNNEFYLEFSKSDITETSNIEISIKYNYDEKTVIFMTNTSEADSTQPVVNVQTSNVGATTIIEVPITLTNVSVEKLWEDNNNQDNVRPSSVKVQLYRNGNEYGEKITLNKSNNWTYTWEKLLDGYTYTVKELNASGNAIEHNEKYNNDYTATYSIVENKTTITNTHIPETINISGTKTWIDGNNQDGKRPESITVNLLADGTKVKEVLVTASNNWEYSFENLPKYNNGEEIIYTITENPVAGYETTIEKFNITNEYIPEMVEKTVTKIWDDNKNQDGKRPDYIKVILYKTVNQEKIEVEEVELNSNKSWTHTWTKLPKYEDGKEIIYSVAEVAPEDYTPTYSEDTFTITNKYAPEKTNKTVIKIWEDSNNQDGVRPDNVRVQLYANNTVYGEAIELNKENSFTYTWLELPRYENGVEIVYSVEEVEVPQGYTVEYSSEDYSNTNEITITNSYIPETVNKTVKKQWNDNENQDKIRPESIQVQLYKKVEDTKTAMGEEYKIVLNEENNWTYIWLDLPAKEDGKQIIYSVEEVEVPQGYTVEYSSEDYSNTNEITITNSYIPETVNKTVKKQWNDNENQDKIRPESIQVQLYKKVEDTKTAMGEEYKIVLNEENNWTYIWLDLPAKEDGKQIIYSVEEVEVPQGYTVEYSSEDYSQVEQITITNTHIPKKFDLSLRKFIAKVNDIEYQREPVVDTSTIETTGTATYKHIKQPIPVQKGDIVTYTIRVYNEGEVDGYVDKITDYLPNNLLPIIEGIEGIDTEKYKDEIDFNSNWLWSYSEDGKTITTTITSKLNTETYSILTGLEEVTDTKLNAYVEGSNTLDYIDVQIKCLVADTASSYEYLTNIAEITESQDINGNMTDGIDSTLGNVDYSNLSDYKNNEAINSAVDSYVPGQEDDDDFEKLVVKEFDLSLRKFITKVNDVMYARVPIVDTSKLGTVVDGKTITTATYNHSKAPVIVETGDIVTYTIRIYNEGSLEGYAKEITDNIPEGLEFLPESEINTAYEWKMLDKEGNITGDISNAVMITTDYLSDNMINHVTEENDIKVLDYKDVEVQFKVVAKAKNLQDNIIINEAQISADSDRDIDSVPNRDEKYDYDFGSNEDDIDYEPIKLQYFDLALRKFITRVNSVDYNNRYPEIIYNEDGSITYAHTKDPVLVTTNDVVTYTIRVYNEGEKAGYATEIKDNLPDGLAFYPDNETNKKYGWKMLDSEGNVTEDASKVVAFSTDYLKDELIDAFKEDDDKKILSYKDVQIAFTVVEPNTSNRILVNTAQISNDSDDDIDSIPNNNIETEDDLDKEYVRVEYFDLALKKWVTRTEVTYNGKTTTTKTGFDEDSEGIAKVDLVASKMTKTTVKFAFNIKVTNEGELPGYAYEVKDYIPKGLKFVAEDNKNWKELEDGTVVTDSLKDTLLNPGESAMVEIVLTWKNSTTNTGLKTNYAEISKDSADDFDSIPDNYDFTEDDIDDAQVLLSIKTAGAPTYIGLILITIAILAGGIFLIKKYVIN